MENITDFEIIKTKDKLQIKYIGSNPKIDKCINELNPKFATLHLVQTLLEMCESKKVDTLSRDHLKRLFDMHFINDCEEVHDAKYKIVDFAQSAITFFTVSDASKQSKKRELLTDFAHHLKNVITSGQRWSIENAIDSFKTTEVIQTNKETQRELLIDFAKWFTADFGDQDAEYWIDMYLNR